MTALERELRALIAQEGPISVERYMQLALTHPRHGYYATRDPLGSGGDFTTAPEISQMFGEMIGIWAAEVWTSMGAPAQATLAELGPGRGTLMMDLLRAAQVVPGFADALHVQLIESSPVLMKVQQQTLARVKQTVSWDPGAEELRRGPAIVVANEFFDALPVRHYVNTADGWFERHVGLAGQDALSFGLSQVAEPSIPAHAEPGAVLEVGVAAHLLVHAIAERLVSDGGALLIVDYGHTQTGVGETLQAVKAHAYVHPLEAPGEADLTAHVDFAALSRAAQAAGAAVYGPVSQGAFLAALGIFQRADGLKSHATRAQAEDIDAALLRLVGEAEGQMGEHFKAMAIVDPRLPPPPGFGVEDAPMAEAVAATAITSEALAVPGIAHAFFTRQGGVSAGVYASLNGGVGSRDDAAAVAENRHRMALHLGVEPERLLVPYQVHSAQALAVSAPWERDARPKVDALVTHAPRLALGVTGADCGIVLFADAQAGVVGAAHAGWKGALHGVLEATIDAMEQAGASRHNLVAVLGPTIGPASYEVGPEFEARFVATDAEYGCFFSPARQDHRMFDLPGFIVARLTAADIGDVVDVGLDTYADETRFYSYRRSVHRGEPDYGRLVAGIALTGG